MKFLSNIVLYVLVICPLFLFAQITPQEAIDGMGRGINLGNTLEPPTEGAWNNGLAQESHFDAYQEAGFTNVRIPVRWDQHTADTPPFAIDADWMDRVEEVVDWGLERGLYITLNGHHEDWLKQNYTNPTLRDRYDAIWEQVSDRFKDKSDKLLFEMINEPKGMTVAQVDDLNERVLGIIRETNPTRIVIFSGNEYANSEQLLQANIPQDDYIIGYYHAYDPWPFSGLGNGTWGTDFDYQQVTNKYTSVKNWSTTNNIPVHHSEFGAIHECDFNSRMRIYAHNIEQCITNGFAFSVWDDGGDFGILNRSNDTWPEVKDILVHYFPDSPNQIFASSTTTPNSSSPAVKLEWNNRIESTQDIVIERSVGLSDIYQQIATVESDVVEYYDTEVQFGVTYTYRMYTTREDGTLIHGYPARTVVNATQQIPFNNAPIIIPGTIEIEEYDFGGEGLAYSDTEPENIPGGTRIGEGVDIGAFDNGFILEYVENGEWLEFTVDVEQAGMYSVTAEVASQIADGSFNLFFADNTVAFNFETPSTGGWTAFIDIVNSNGFVPLIEGVQVMRMNITSENPFNVDRLIFSLEPTATNEVEIIENALSVFPNPASQLINVELDESYFTEGLNIDLYKISGEKIRTFEMTNPSMQINVDSLISGVYIMKIKGKDFITEQRILVNK